MVEKLDNSEAAKSEWNDFLRLSVQGSIFSSTLYLDALDVKYSLYVSRHHGRIDAGLPLVRGIAGLLTNPLFCKYLGVLVLPSLSEKASIAAGQVYRQIDAFRHILRASRSFDYMFHPNFENWLPLYWMGFAQQTLYTYRISKSRRSIWWDQADSRLRRAVRRGEKAKISVTRIENLDSANASLCYALSMEPFRQRNARPPMSAIRFERLVRELGPSGSLGLWIARDARGMGVAAAGVLYDWRCAYLLLNGTSDAAPTGTNSLLIKTIIDDTLERNLDFDFEGSMIRPIEAFYRGFGGDRISYYRIWNPTVVNALKRRVMKWARRIGRYDR
jgi:Acetyltransferase (GNAT) domain